MGKLTVKNNYLEILEAIKNQHGIEVIRDFVKSYNKNARKKQNRVNKNIEIANEVYKLIVLEDYDKTRAFYKISDDKNIAYYTVRNHCYTFDKKAKEFDYVNFGKKVEEKTTEATFFTEISNTISKIADIDYTFAETCYLKYAYENNLIISDDRNYPRANYLGDLKLYQ